MNADQLLQLSAVYVENRPFITNEETAKMALVVPFIRLLGYDPNTPREVRLEYCADFTQGDGKKFADRMDFAIFDRTNAKPLIVIETKPLGTNLRSKSQQLARYIAQLPDLHFGIMTDGCVYQFYGDLESPNVMDSEPFFAFALDDSKTDWSKVASFLSKFSRDAFNAVTLITDAENSRYRQAMVDKLVRVLRAPGDDEAFIRWLTADIYGGKRTSGVMSRLAELAREAVEPALLRVMGDDFVDKLKQRITAAREPQADGQDWTEPPASSSQASGVTASTEQTDDVKKGIVTTEEELRFHTIVADICARAGHERSRILLRDTVNYCNVSLDRPTKWFLRYFGEAKRKHLVTPLPTSVAKELAPGLEVEEAPPVFGTSRIYVSTVEQTLTLDQLVLRSLETLTGA